MAIGKFLKEAVLEGMIFSGIVTLMKKLSEKGVEKVEKRIEQALGLSSEDALKSDKDEIALAKVLVKGRLLKPDQKKEARAWIGNLQETNPLLANELTKRIYNILVETTTEDQSTEGTGEKAKKKTFKNDADGILIAESLLLEILEAPEGERLAVLKRNNIRVIPKKLHPQVEKAKQFAKKTVEKVAEAAKTTSEKVVETAKAIPLKELSEKIDESIAENSADWTKKSSDFAASQKAKYEAAKKSKR